MPVVAQTTETALRSFVIGRNKILLKMQRKVFRKAESNIVSQIAA